MTKYVIFGAGIYGRQALEKLGQENVLYFIDNDKSKQGTEFCGKRIIAVDELAKSAEKYHVVIASVYGNSMEKQLNEIGYHNYSFFLDEYFRFYETDELIFNPYETNGEVKNEEEWKQSLQLQNARNAVNEKAEFLYGKKNLFSLVEVETINRCNGVCSFCPVNRNVDPREEKMMTKELFESIVDQLAEMNYAGRFTTFSNNEPLLDKRIVEFNRYARKKLPNAKIHLFTNGTLFTIELFKELIEYLDELIIDNYHQELRLIKPCEEIKQYCQLHPHLKSKVTIVLRKPQEILTSRGGNAPNRKDVGIYTEDRCILPFKQLIIRPDGKISLCCNDAIGKYTLGDVSKDKILDIWYGPRFEMVRKSLYEGRKNWGECQHCDNFSLG